MNHCRRKVSAGVITAEHWPGRIFFFTVSNCFVLFSRTYISEFPILLTSLFKAALLGGTRLTCRTAHLEISRLTFLSSMMARGDQPQGDFLMSHPEMTVYKPGGTSAIVQFMLAWCDVVAAITGYFTGSLPGTSADPGLPTDSSVFFPFLCWL